MERVKIIAIPEEEYNANQRKLDELEKLINDISKERIKKPTKYLSRKDVSQMFGVSLVTISAWMRTGKLPYIRVNRRVYFIEEEILESLKKFDHSKSN